jgi:DNA-binding transcriptional ArsR family regulator
MSHETSPKALSRNEREVLRHLDAAKQRKTIAKIAEATGLGERATGAALESLRVNGLIDVLWRRDGAVMSVGPTRLGRVFARTINAAVREAVLPNRRRK